MKKSILIITYGRDEEFFDTLKCISKYDEDDIEVLILDNNKNNELESKIHSIFKDCSFKYKYFSDGTNYGVALGRNYLIKEATGDVLITLDDDVEFDSINELVGKVENYFNKYSSVGCLAFNIKNFYTRESVSYEIPHGNKTLDFTKNLYTYYFIGAGHAIRKDVYEKAGLYPEDLGLYGGEELDLSFRMLEGNFKILYTADITIYHKASIKGRMSSSEQSFMKYQNRIKVIYKYMPNKYVLTNIGIWSVYFLIKQKNLKNVFIAIRNLKNTPRNKVSKNVIGYLKEIKARLLY